MRVKSSQTQTVSTGEGHGTWPQPLLSQESPSGTHACTHRYEGEPGRLRTLARGRQDTVREGVSGGGAAYVESKPRWTTWAAGERGQNM